MGDGKKPINSHVSGRLCNSYRETIDTKITALDDKLDSEIVSVTKIFTGEVNALKNTILGALTISTLVITIVMWTLQAGGG